MATPPIFGCIIPGRLAQFEAQQVSETQLLFVIPNCEQINHVVIFLTGSQPLPEGFAAGIYLFWPKPQPAWFMLGHISNTKPSAIYKIAKPKEAAVENMFSSWQMNATDAQMAQIGISMEPISEVVQKTPASASVDTVSSFVDFTQKMLNNLFNYLSSYAKKQSEMTADPVESFVPLSCLQKWYENFQRRMNLDPNFWKKL